MLHISPIPVLLQRVQHERKSIPPPPSYPHPYTLKAIQHYNCHYVRKASNSLTLTASVIFGLSQSFWSDQFRFILRCFLVPYLDISYSPDKVFFFFKYLICLSSRENGFNTNSEFTRQPVCNSFREMKTLNHLNYLRLG